MILLGESVSHSEGRRYNGRPPSSNLVQKICALQANFTAAYAHQDHLEADVDPRFEASKALGLFDLHIVGLWSRALEERTDAGEDAINVHQ
jgi:hypothetical protein